jgi:RNA polymerase sigma factor (sigma-70 family)
MPELSRRLTYYRRLAMRIGIPLQFVDDAVHDIDRAVTTERAECDDDPSHWKRTARLRAIDQLRIWRGVDSDRKALPELRSLDELLRPGPISGANRSAAAELQIVRPPHDSVDPLDEQDKRRAVGELLAVLPAREHALVQLRLDGWTLLEIGEVLDVSESRASRLEKQAIGRLRKALVI